MSEAQNQYPQNTHPANQPDVYVRCPYFPEHELRRSRLPYHLLKCQRNPAAPKLVACPFNYLHRVKPEDRHEHLLLCEDRVFFKYSDKDLPSYANTRQQFFGLTPRDPVPDQPQRQVEDGEECWE